MCGPGIIIPVKELPSTVFHSGGKIRLPEDIFPWVDMGMWEGMWEGRQLEQLLVEGSQPG